MEFLTAEFLSLVGSSLVGFLFRSNAERRKEQAEVFYSVHKEKPFFKDLVEYMVSGPVMVQILEGESAIETNRRIMGATDPSEAVSGSIRADFAESIEKNIVHGSDGKETASQEIEFFFGIDGICL